MAHTLIVRPGEHLVGPRMVVEWETYSFHEAFDDAMAPANWVRDEGGFLPGCLIRTHQSHTVNLTRLHTGFGEACREYLYLELPALSEKGELQCKTLITGKNHFERQGTSRISPGNGYE